MQDPDMLTQRRQGAKGTKKGNLMRKVHAAKVLPDFHSFAIFFAPLREVFLRFNSALILHKPITAPSRPVSRPWVS